MCARIEKTKFAPILFVAGVGEPKAGSGDIAEHGRK
jgi:hypothetical protein